MASSLLDPSRTAASARDGRHHDTDHSTDGAMSPVRNQAVGGGGRASRKRILCFDGTGNKFHGDESDSNILKIFRMLDRTASDQYHYYQREETPPRPSFPPESARSC